MSRKSIFALSREELEQELGLNQGPAAPVDGGNEEGYKPITEEVYGEAGEEAEDGASVQFDNDVENLDKTMDVVESLENLRVKLSTIKSSGKSLSTETIRSLGLGVSVVFSQNGRAAQLPLSMSTEQVATVFGKTTLTTAIESVDYRIDMLSREADNLIRRIWEGLRDAFGRETDRSERLRQKIDRAIKQLESANDFDGNQDIDVPNLNALKIGGSVAPEKVLGNLAALNNNVVDNGVVFNLFLEGFLKVNDFVGSYSGDISKLDDAVAKKNFYKLPKPFVESRSGNDGDFHNFEATISDEYRIELQLPTGLKAMFPKTGADNSREAVYKSGKSSTKSLDKDSCLKLLREFREVIKDTPNAKQLDGIVNRFRKDVANLANGKITYKRLDEEIKKTTTADTARLLSGLFLSPSLCLFLGPAIIVRFFSEIGSWIAEKNGSERKTESLVDSDNFTDNKASILRAIMQGLVRGQMGSIIGRLTKETMQKVENKLSVYFINFYRKYYAMLCATGDAICKYVDESAKKGGIASIMKDEEDTTRDVRRRV